MEKKKSAPAIHYGVECTGLHRYKQKNSPIITSDGGFMKNMLLNPYGFSWRHSENHETETLQILLLLLLLLYHGMVVTSCQRQVALLSPSSLPPPPRRSAPDFRYIFYFIFSFTSIYPRPIVHPRSVYVCRPFGVVCVLRSFTCRPVLVSYVHFGFFLPIVFLCSCFFFIALFVVRWRNTRRGLTFPKDFLARCWLVSYFLQWFKYTLIFFSMPG